MKNNIKFETIEILDLIAFCKHDIKQSKRIIQQTHTKDTDFIDSMQHDIRRIERIIEKLENLLD